MEVDEIAGKKKQKPDGFCVVIVDVALIIAGSITYMDEWRRHGSVQPESNARVGSEFPRLHLGSCILVTVVTTKRPKLSSTRRLFRLGLMKRRLFDHGMESTTQGPECPFAFPAARLLCHKFRCCCRVPTSC